MTKRNKKTKGSFAKDMIMSFALVLSIMFGLVLIPYSIIKNIFSLYFGLIIIAIIIAYAIFWGVMHYNRKTANFL